MRLTYLFLLMLPLGANAYADDAAPPSNDSYFPAASLPATLLSLPLSPHSPAWDDEVNQMVLMQKTVTDYDREQITAEIGFGPEIFNSAAPNWDGQHYPATFHLLYRSLSTCLGVVEQDKAYFNTTRPYKMDARIHSLAGDPGNASYPSGHTACTRVMAEVLGEVLPDKLGPLRDRAETVAQHRIMAGVHYPHDIRGGEQLAMVLMGAFEETPAFQADLQAANNEMHPPINKQ